LNLANCLERDYCIAEEESSPEDKECMKIRYGTSQDFNTHLRGSQKQETIRMVRGSEVLLSLEKISIKEGRV